MRYYTADPHFGHANIIDHCDRPFSSADAMDRAIVEAWRRVLTEEDLLYVLGDLGEPPTGTEHVRTFSMSARRRYGGYEGTTTATRGQMRWSL